MQTPYTSICVFTKRSTIGFRSVLNGIVYAARKQGWSVRAIELDGVSVGIDELLREWKPLGALSYSLDPADFPQTRPTVHINPKITRNGLWTVIHDSRETGRLAARELMKLAGRAFAYVGSPANDPWSRIRGESFRETLVRFGFGCTECTAMQTSRNPLDAQRHLKRFLKGIPLPCAVFAANDRMSEEVLTAALAAGLNVPDDLAILGVDNDETRCENAAVTLSSLVPDFFHGGIAGCELLAKRIRGTARSSSESREFYGDLGVIARASTRPQQKPNAHIARLREFIRRNAPSGISAADVIREAKLSRRTAELAFRAATGNSIGEEIQANRLERAKILLADASVPIGDIPGLVGYVSLNQLERLFRRNFGMTMRAFRSSAYAGTPASHDFNKS